jgi:hypothetical protein
MAIVDRNFTYRGRIKVSAADLAAAGSGAKTCTIRLGRARVASDVVDLVAGNDALRVRVVSVSVERYRDLSLDHARCEGFSSVDELRRDLEQYYRNIEPDQPVTIIRFDRVP